MREVKQRRTSTDVRLVLSVLLACLPLLAMSFGFLYLVNVSLLIKSVLALAVLGFVAAVTEYVRSTFNNHVRVTLNLVASIRSHDFSLRASEVEQRGEVADLFRELNLVADEIKHIREDELDARRLLEQIVAQVNVAIVVLDAHGVIKLVNPFAELLLGSRAREILGKHVDTTMLREVTNSTGQWIDHEIPGVEGRWHVVVQSYRERGVPGRIVMMSDLEHILTHVESQAWRRLIRVIAHEVNNSLTPIISVSQTARRLLERPADDARDGQVKQAVQVVGTRAGNLRQFISEYVALARLPEPQLGDVKIAGSMQLVERTMHAKGVTFRHDARCADTVIEGDQAQIEQVLINLIKNAMEAQEKNPVVEVRYTVNQGRCEIEIADRGPGFSNPGDAFVPFYTTKARGAGIGLALCRQIVSNHFGKIYVENRADGVGAIVKVVLPLRRLKKSGVVQSL